MKNKRAITHISSSSSSHLDITETKEENNNRVTLLDDSFARHETKHSREIDTLHRRNNITRRIYVPVSETKIGYQTPFSELRTTTNYEDVSMKKYRDDTCLLSTQKFPLVSMKTNRSEPSFNIKSIFEGLTFEQDETTAVFSDEEAKKVTPVQIQNDIRRLVSNVVSFDSDSLFSDSFSDSPFFDTDKQSTNTDNNDDGHQEEEKEEEVRFDPLSQNKSSTFNNLLSVSMLSSGSCTPADHFRSRMDGFNTTACIKPRGFTRRRRELSVGKKKEKLYRIHCASALPELEESIIVDEKCSKNLEEDDSHRKAIIIPKRLTLHPLNFPQFG